MEFSDYDLLLPAARCPPLLHGLLQPGWLAFKGGAVRKRMISPEFWTDEKIVELSPWARLLFIGLWQLADDEGRLEWNPRKVHLQLFPADHKIDMEKLCAELRQSALICAYSCSNHSYIEVTGFKKHQKLDSRRPSKFPAPVCADLRHRTELNLTELEPNRTESKKQKQKQTVSLEVKNVITAYKLVKNPDSSRHDGTTKVEALLKSEATEAQLCLAADRYRQECEAEKTENKYRKGVAPFYGPKAHWRGYLEEDWSPPYEQGKTFRQGATKPGEPEKYDEKGNIRDEWKTFNSKRIRENSVG